jgi:hypothetical protein
VGSRISTWARATRTSRAGTLTDESSRSTVRPPCVNRATGVSVRGSVAQLRTWTLRSTTARPARRRVRTVGARSSLEASSRSVTSRLIPPKLNHARCQPSRFIRIGLRQSARTTTSCSPALSSRRISNGR